MNSVSRYVFARCLRHSLLGLCTGLLAAGGCSPAEDRAPGDMTGSVHAAATVSPEVIVTEPVQAPALGRWPSAAFNGTQYLTVWEDFRAGRPILYGARVAADGTALDGAGIPLLDALPDKQYPREYDAAVASDGQGFLVVTEADGQILGVRVSQDGEVLDPDGFAISTSTSQAARPALAFDGEQYLVAWVRPPVPGSADSGVYWARVTPDGTVLDPGGVRGFALEDYSQIGVSFDGTNYLLSWLGPNPETQRRNVFAARIRTDGTPIDTARFRVTPSDMSVLTRTSPVGAFDGTNHVIMWESIVPDDEDLNPTVVRVTRVTPQGAVLDAAGIEVHRQFYESSDVHRLAITAAGGRSTTVIGVNYGGEGGPSGSSFEMAQVAADGTLTEHPADELFAGLEPTVVAHPAGALLLWRDGDSLARNTTQIAAARLDAAGQPLASGQVTPASSVSRQEVRGVASDGRTFFVVWSDTRAPETEGKALYGSRVTADGTPLDGQGIQLTTEPADVVEVLFDGASFVVVWAEHTGGEGNGSPFELVRVRPDGEVLEVEAPEEPWLASPERTMAGASDGTHTLLVGDDHNSARIELAALLVDQQGAPVSEIVPLVEKEPLGDYISIRHVAASFDGTGYLVIWYERWDELLGQMVGADGAAVGGTFRIAEDPEIHHATVRFGGGNHLVVWQDQDGIRATRVTPDARVLDPEGKLIAAGTAIDGMCCHSVAFDGASFLVAWQAPEVPGDPHTMNVYGAEVSPDGEVLDSFTISSEPGREGAPFLAATAYGHVLAAFSRFVPGAPFDTQQVRARFLTEGGPIPDLPDAGPIDPGPDAGPPGPTPDAGGSPAEPLPGDGDGCGCTVGAAQPTPVAPLLLLGGVVGLWLVRRRGRAPARLD